MAPAGIDKAAAVNEYSDTQSVEELLNLDPTPALDTTPLVDISQPISYWGNLKDLGLDYGWGTSAFFENMMEISYLNLEMGWVGSIATSAIILRTILFFGFQIRGSDSLAKLASMKPILQPLMDQMEEAKRRGDDEKVQTLKLRQQTIMKEVGTDLVAQLGTPIVGMATGFGAFRCLRGMAELPVPGMSTESFLWINDLTISDPYMILPLMTGAMMFGVMKLGGETGMTNATTMSSMQKNLQIVVPCVMAGVTTFQPAAVQIYFFLSSFMAGSTAHMLRQNAVRRFLKIRILPTPASDQFFQKVVKGEIKLDAVKGNDGKIRYQAPNAPLSNQAPSSKPSSSKPPPSVKPASPPSPPPPRQSKSSNPQPHTPIKQSRGIGTLKTGTRLPTHISNIPFSSPPVDPATAPAKPESQGQDRDNDDVESDAELLSEGGARAKWEWIKRKTGRAGSWVREKLDFDKRDADVRKAEEKRKRQEGARRRYEDEKRRRLTGR
ncbi:hypothetical protein P280DRAFT_388297 [Massarina eburnea CBS 473.64]|uniref:Membrane insertase YidC/Oxa/ALB C-terminal domain-containing protein n=1 Tax=Massarina eburnea CBS 473.64 TaxID=1395130 RepID=A0A6A6SL66_9PLEO|nr:hypothetical protein P280DRAFT_388297 [Massarina eburnea CBS 473.64]